MTKRHGYSAAELRDERIIQEWGWRWTAHGDSVTTETGMSDDGIRANDAAARILNRIVRLRKAGVGDAS